VRNPTSISLRTPSPGHRAGVSLHSVVLAWLPYTPHGNPQCAFLVRMHQVSLVRNSLLSSAGPYLSLSPLKTRRVSCLPASQTSARMPAAARRSCSGRAILLLSMSKLLPTQHLPTSRIHSPRVYLETLPALETTRALARLNLINSSINQLLDPALLRHPHPIPPPTLGLGQPSMLSRSTTSANLLKLPRRTQQTRTRPLGQPSANREVTLRRQVLFLLVTLQVTQPRPGPPPDGALR